MQLGINIAGNSDYNSDETFANLFLNSRSPQQQNFNNPAVRLGVDAQGWPTEDFRQVIYGNLLVYYVTNAGTYAIKFTGIATISANTSGTITSQSYDAATNTTTATLVGSGTRGDLWLDFTGTKRNAAAAANSGITNIFIMRPIAQGSTTPHDFGEFLSRNFTNFVANGAYVAFRFMEFIGTNSYATATFPNLAWAQRTPGYAPNQSGSYTGSIGASVELCCKVCNAIHKDLYVNVPDVADDDYILKFLQTIAFGSDGTLPYTSLQSSPAYPPLDPGLKVYLEWGNELWNYSYPFAEAFARNRNSAVSEAAAGDPIGYDGARDIITLGQRRVAKKIAHVSTVARGVFGDDQMMVRVRPVLMGFDVVPSNQLEGLRFLQDFYQQRSSPSHPVNYYLWGAGNGSYRNLANSDGSGATSADVLLGSGIGLDTAGVELLPRYYHSYGLKAISYESALEVGGDTVTEFTYATNLDPRMRPLAKEYYDRLARAGYDLPFIFQTSGGNYAQCRSSEPLDRAVGPKYLAALDFITSGANYIMPDFVDTTIAVPQGTITASTPLLMASYTFPVAGFLTILAPGNQSGSGLTLALLIDGVQVATSNCLDVAVIPSGALSYSKPMVAQLAVGSHAIQVIATAPMTTPFGGLARLTFLTTSRANVDYDMQRFSSFQQNFTGAVTPPTANFGAELTMMTVDYEFAQPYISIAGYRVGFFYNTFGIFSSTGTSIASQTVAINGGNGGGINGSWGAEVIGNQLRAYIDRYQIGDAQTITPVSQASGFVMGSAGHVGSATPQFKSYTVNLSAPATTVPTNYVLDATAASASTGSPVTITATVNAAVTGSSLVITLVDSLGSTISGAITIAVGATTGTGTINPTAVGAHAVTATHTGGGFTGGDGSITFVATAPALIVLGVTSVGHYASPGNHDDDGTGTNATATIANNVRNAATKCWSQYPGSYSKFRWTTTGSGHAVLICDVSHYAAITTNNYPFLKYRVNSGLWQSAQVPASGRLDVTNAGISAPGTYQLVVVLMASDQTQDRYGASSGAIPANSVVVSGLEVDSGSTAVAPAIASKVLLVFTDSIGEGVRVLNTTTGDLVSNDSTLTWAWQLAQAGGYELGMIGLGGWGYERPSVSGFPKFATSWQLQSNGRTRDTTQPVDTILIVHGTNDALGGTASGTVTTDVAAVLTAMRTAYPSTKLIPSTPFGGFLSSAILAGFNSYQATTADAACRLYTPSASISAPIGGSGTANFATIDGIHPNRDYSGVLSASVGQFLATSIVNSGAGTAQSGDTYALLAGLLTGNALSAAALANVPRSGYTLAATGLDLIQVEAGVNVRQALSPILAACAGIVSGAGSGIIAFRGGNSQTTRITAFTDSVGNRSTVALVLPS